MSITRTLAAALAIGALVAPAAQAQPADMHQHLARTSAQAQNRQDMRSPDAQDAARHPRDAGSAARGALPGPPTWPAHPQAIAPAPAVETTDGSGVDWTPIMLGVAASLLAMAGLVALNSRRMRRLHRPRVTV